MYYGYYEWKRDMEYRERHATHKVVFNDGSEKRIYKGEINSYKGRQNVSLIMSIY